MDQGKTSLLCVTDRGHFQRVGVMSNQNNQQNSGGGDADLLPQLQAEKDSLDPSFMHASRLLDKGTYLDLIKFMQI